MSPAGFEPAPPKRTELKSVALDHSAIETCCFCVLQDTIFLFFKSEKILLFVSLELLIGGLEPPTSVLLHRIESVLA